MLALVRVDTRAVRYLEAYASYPPSLVLMRRIKDVCGTSRTKIWRLSRALAPR